MNHRGSSSGQRLAETTDTNDASIFAPRGVKYTDSTADAGVALRGQTVADSPAGSGNTTGEPGNAEAAADVTGTSKAYVIVYAPDNQGEININAEANTVVMGRANATAPDGGATGQAGNAKALVNLNGESDAQIFLYAPNNQGIINREAIANTTLTGQADADASGNGLALSQVDALLASQTGEHALHGNQGSGAIADSVWFG
jgi:hypothetical protein